MHTSVIEPTFAVWLDNLKRTCGSFEAQPQVSGTAFQGQIHKREAGNLEIAEITTNARRIARSRPNSDRGEDRFCFLIAQRRGKARIYQQDRYIEMMPGEVALVDSGKECEILPHGYIEHHSFHLPRCDVAERFPEQEVPFGKMSSSSASGQILHLIINRIASYQLAEPLSNEDGAGLRDSLISLLPATCNQGLGLSDDELHISDLYFSVQQLIDQRLQDERLSPAFIADELNISIRQLYRIFEFRDETVCRYIQKRRLERCAEELANPRFIKLTITQIAYKWGFTDSAHFSRSFKKAFSRSPRQYRNEMLFN